MFNPFDVFQRSSKSRFVPSGPGTHSQVQAVIELLPDGMIVGANDAMLHMAGYGLTELAGQHHRMLVPPALRENPAYDAFWQGLAEGRGDSGHYALMTHGGGECWVQGGYVPVTDRRGKVVRVVGYLMDVTEQRRRQNDLEAQLAAIGKSQGVIEFDLDGTVLRANENFLDAMGYRDHEVVGKHHRLFVDPALHETPEYRAFWHKLGQGAYDAGQYRRIGKNGREVWIQASYNPVLDENGRAFKVIKVASDVTQRARDMDGVMQELRRSVQEMHDIMVHIRQAVSGQADGIAKGDGAPRDLM